MIIRKQIVLVDQPDGALRSLEQSLGDSGYQILLVSEATMLLDTIENQRRLALVIINGRQFGVMGASLVSIIKLQHPELPIIYCQDPQAPTTFFAQRPDCIITGTVSVDLVNQDANTLLREGLYPPVLVEGLQNIAREMLSSFGSFSVSDEPFLKTRRTLLLPLNAMIPLVGSQHMEGHLFVSATEDTLQRAYTTLFGEEPGSIAVLEDLAGEICNMIAGGLKSFIEQKGTSVVIGVPTFVRGNQISFRRGTPTPSLTLGATLEGKPDVAGANGDDLFIELYFERIDPAIFQSVDQVQQLDAEEMTFL